MGGPQQRQDFLRTTEFRSDDRGFCKVGTKEPKLGGRGVEGLKRQNLGERKGRVKKLKPAK